MFYCVDVVAAASIIYSYLNALFWTHLHYITALHLWVTEWGSRLQYSKCVYSSACIHQACQDGGADWGSVTRCPCSLMAMSSVIVGAKRNLAIKLEPQTHRTGVNRLYIPFQINALTSSSLANTLMMAMCGALMNALILMNIDIE